MSGFARATATGVRRCVERAVLDAVGASEGTEDTYLARERHVAALRAGGRASRRVRPAHVATRPAADRALRGGAARRAGRARGDHRRVHRRRPAGRDLRAVLHREVAARHELPSGIAAIAVDVEPTRKRMLQRRKAGRVATLRGLRNAIAHSRSRRSSMQVRRIPHDVRPSRVRRFGRARSRGALWPPPRRRARQPEDPGARPIPAAAGTRPGARCRRRCRRPRSCQGSGRQQGRRRRHHRHRPVRELEQGRSATR